jgi:hypothetical protein
VYVKLGGEVKTAYQFVATTDENHDGTTIPGTAGDNWDTTTWGDGSTDGGVSSFAPVRGRYAAANIKGMLEDAGLPSKVLAIKNTNQALRFYTGAPALLTGRPVHPVTADTGNGNTTWIPDTAAESPVRWRLYGQGAIVAGDVLGILIWDGGTDTTYNPKTATLEIESYTANSDAAAAAGPTGDVDITVIVDYSGVTWATASE